MHDKITSRVQAEVDTILIQSKGAQQQQLVSNKTKHTCRDIFKMFERARSIGHYVCNGKIQLPEEILITIFEFLEKRDLILSLSHVSIGWATASLSPFLPCWQRINKRQRTKCCSSSTHKRLVSPLGKEKNMDKEEEFHLMQLLNRPQFAKLKKLVIPMQPTLSILEDIAHTCPHLEEMYHLVQGGAISITEDDGSMVLRKLPKLFPRMKKLAISISTNKNDLLYAIQTMGCRLEDIDIIVTTGRVVYQHDEDTVEHEVSFTNQDFAMIGKHCPNLKKFSYSDDPLSIKKDHYDGGDHDSSNSRAVTLQGLSALIDGCPRLESLYLLFSTCSAFQDEEYSYIAWNAKCLRRLNIWHPFLTVTAFTPWDANNYHQRIREILAHRLEGGDLDVGGDDDFLGDYDELFMYKLLPIQ